MHEELNQSFYIRSFPFKITIWVVCGTDFGVDEELAGILEMVGIVRRECELKGAAFYLLDNSFERPVFADEFEGGVRAHFRDGIEIIAAEKYTKIDELVANGQGQ